MASPACQKLSPLPRIIPDRPRYQFPRHSLLPFPASPSSHQDALPYTSFPQSFLMFPSPPLANAPFVRTVFENAVCPCPVPEQQRESAENLVDSSSSSCFMSSNSDDDDDEDDTGSSSASSFSQLASPSVDAVTAHEGPLDDLTSLCAALPIKRGLSLYFSGKSQSFSSLAQVSSVADLAKPENPFVKRRRMGGGTDSVLKHHSYPPRCTSSTGISKRPTTSNRCKSLKSLPEVVLSEGHARLKLRPAKCFSVPEI